MSIKTDNLQKRSSRTRGLEEIWIGGEWIQSDPQTAWNPLHPLTPSITPSCPSLSAVHLPPPPLG